MRPANVPARLRSIRRAGDDVLFICGKLVRGTPVELAAEAKGQDATTFGAEQHAIQADIYRRFGLSFDHFGHSSSPQSHALTQHFYRSLDAASLIEERELNFHAAFASQSYGNRRAVVE